MTGINSENDLYAALPSAQRFFANKSSVASTGQHYTSLWRSFGQPLAGAAPGSTTGVACSSATTGAIPFINPATGKLSYIVRQWALSQSANIVINIGDRLVHSDGLDASSTGVQPVGTPALPRYTDGVGVELWLEVYATLGASPSFPSASYTNSDGVSGRTAITYVTNFGSSAGAGRMYRMILQAGDLGVRSVESVTLSATTGAPGNFGVTLSKPLADIVTGATGYLPGVQGPFACGMPQVQDNACLFYYCFTPSTSTGFIAAGMSIAQG